MKSLNTYLNESLLDDEDTFLDPERDKVIIEKWIKENYRTQGSIRIHDNMVVDCSSSLAVLGNRRITSLTNGLFRWGKVGGSFDCSFCKSLKSLEGAPKSVKDCFNCSGCKNLESLKGAPKEVGKNFDCSWCDNLESLEGSPEVIRFSYYCSRCSKLKSLEGAPKHVYFFDCHNCESLKTLEGAPEKVDGTFRCNGCTDLQSLKGAPREIGLYLICASCPNLTIDDSIRKKYNIVD